MDDVKKHRMTRTIASALAALLLCAVCFAAPSAFADSLDPSSATASATASSSSAADAVASSSSSAVSSASSSATSSANSSATASSTPDATSSTTSSVSNEEAVTAVLRAASANAPLAENVAATAAASDGTVRIQYDTEKEIHYVDDPESANGRIILYCMNNASHWPHTTPSIPTVPSYIQGYLTPEKFKSQADYEACMDKLLAILYAGYPYNGMNMYTVVDSTTGITEDQFNALLNPPSWIRSDFPDSIGDTVFSYSDYPDNTANLKKLRDFVSDELFNYYFTGATTPSGHTSGEIRATPFYQAATAMAYANNDTPLKVWDLSHSDADRVTESEAYNATQYAI
ncbi:MAG: hypothetical protein PUE02_06645, partial [Eggerthellaceae bacterium]|nr:hypothetical protein [Eggerthellaceae bacterium]